LIVMLSCVALEFVALWAWVLYKPMAYLDGAYPQWMLKRRWLENCELGDLTILGDSRVQAAMVAKDIPLSTVNLAGPGGGPLEAAYIADQIVRCPVHPKRVLLSLNMTTLTHIGPTWEVSIRDGFLPFGFIQTVRRVGWDVRDSSFDDVESSDRIPHSVRPWAYRVRFPPIFLDSLIKGIEVNRQARNMAIFETTMRTQGQLIYGDQDGWGGWA
jgi:hypothetical protein